MATGKQEALIVRRRERILDSVAAWLNKEKVTPMITAADDRGTWKNHDSQRHGTGHFMSALILLKMERIDKS